MFVDSGEKLVPPYYVDVVCLASYFYPYFTGFDVDQACIVCNSISYYKCPVYQKLYRKAEVYTVADETKAKHLNYCHF
jgi:hypothetical protein